MKSINKQAGVVLFFALILLIVMTFIGVALAVNAGQSLRMAGAGTERIEAKALADGGLANALNTVLPSYWATIVLDEGETSVANDGLTYTPLPIGNVPKSVACQRSSEASATNLIACRRIEISNNVVYGRDDLGSITVTQGIEQEVLNGSGS